MSQASTSYTAEKLYEEAYNIQYNWDKILPSDVVEFHTYCLSKLMHPSTYRWEQYCLSLPGAWVLKHVDIFLPVHRV